MTVYRNRILPHVREQRLLYDVTLELTYRCNLDCFFCYNDRGKPGTPLSLEQYDRLLHDLARMQTLFLMLTGGEPMVHPHFFDIGRIANELGFVTRIRTNGHSLTAKVARRVVDEINPYCVEVSLHGASAEAHERQTRVAGSFDRLVRNIRTSLDAGLRMSVVTTPTAWNEHEILGMFDLCDGLGVPLRVQGPVAPRDNGDTEPLSIRPKDETWRIAEREAMSRKQARYYKDAVVNIDVSRDSGGDELATCGVGVAGVDIDPYGNVLACMHLQSPAGNIHDQSIEEIWNHSPLFSRARKRAVDAAKQFVDIPVRQMGASVYCLAVEENLSKGCSAPCGDGCGRHS